MLTKIISSATNWFKTKQSSGGLPLGLVWALQNIGFTWNYNYERNYYNKMVYAVENLIVTKSVEVEITVSKIINKKAARKYSKYIVPELIYAFKQVGFEDATDSEIQMLLDKPNSYQTRIEFMESFWYNYNLGQHGGMIWAEMPGNDARRMRPIALHVLPSNLVSITQSNDFRNPIAKIIFTTYQGQTFEINPANVMVLQRWNPESNIYSFSTQKAAQPIIARNDANTIAQGSAFVNGGTGILLSSDIAVVDGNVVNKMSAEQMSALKDQITKTISGAHNNKKINYTNGHVKVDKLGDTMADLQLVEAANNDWKEYAALRGVNPVLIGSEKASTESNVIEARKALVTGVVLPQLRKFDEKITEFLSRLFDVKGYSINHEVTDYTELTPDLKMLKDTFGSPVLTIDEQRAIYDYESLGQNGEKILVPNNLQTLDDLLMGQINLNP